MGSTERNDEDVVDGPGRSCLRGALAEMRILYVIRATDKVTRTAKKRFPQPIFLIKLSLKHFVCPYITHTLQLFTGAEMKKSAKEDGGFVKVVAEWLNKR